MRLLTPPLVRPEIEHPYKRSWLLLATTQGMLIHFKCNYDPAWDYPSICQSFFGNNQCLCQAEKMMTNAHVHFQGDTDLTPKQVEKADEKSAGRGSTSCGAGIRLKGGTP